MEIRNSSFLKLNICEKMLLLLVIIIVFCNFFVSKYAGIVSYGTYFSLMLVTIYMFSKKKLFVNSRWGIISCFLFFAGIFSSIRGEYVIGNVLNNVHQHFFFGLFLFLSMYVRWDKYISGQFIPIFMKVVLAIGLIATAYAFVVQGELIPQIIRTNKAIYYQLFKSLFVNRNVFAVFLFFSSIASLYHYSLTKKKRYIIYIVIFGFQTYLASSKASLVAIGILVCVFFYLKTKNKTFVIVIGVIALFPILYYIVLPMFSNLAHLTNDGISSSEIRLQNWVSGIQKLIQESALINGLGMGSEVNFLREFRRYGSFHNVYIDLLFQGGIIKLSIYLFALKEIWTKIRKSSDVNVKMVISAAFIAFFAHSLVESGAMLFSNTYCSFLSTVCFAIIPQCTMIRKVEASNEIDCVQHI